MPFLDANWNKYGDVFQIRIMGFDALVLANPEHIQKVLLTNRRNYYKGPAYDNVRSLLGDGLVTLEGDAWKERRTLVQPAFHRQSLEKLSVKMVDSGARYFDALAQRIGRQGHVDIHAEMVRLTLDVVINALFGRGLLEESEISYGALGDALHLLSTGANGVRLPSWVPTPRNIKFNRMVRALDKNVFEIIRAARERVKRGDDEGTLLAMLLAARDERGQPLTDRELRNEVLTLFLAGHETTAVTLTWLFALLSDAPDVHRRVREEVDSVLGGREPTFDDVPKLSYIRQVIDETLRLRSPATGLPRNAYADDEIGGFQVQAGQAVLPFIWGAHRHPDFWPEPLRFDPERFAPGANKGRHSCSYLPFAAGPRACIGNSFSLIETALLLAQLFTRFEVVISSCADVKPVALGTVRPSKPVRVRLTRRT